MTDLSLMLRIQANGAQAARELQRLNAGLGTVATSADRAAAATDKIKNSLARMGHATAAAFGGREVDPRVRGGDCSALFWTVSVRAAPS